MDNSQLLIGTLIILGVVSLIAYLIAEYIGRQKHIGGWWSFILVLTALPSFLITGLIAVISSPSAKEKPTGGNDFRFSAGVLLIAWAVLLVFTLNNTPHGFFWRAKVSYIVMLFPLGVYLLVLGQGLIVNKSPRYRENKFNSWFGGLMTSVKKNIRIPDLSSSNTKNGNEDLYYIQEKGQATGPYTIDELKSKRIHESVLVCKNGDEKWVNATYYKNLKNLIIYSPPPIIPIDNKIADAEAKAEENGNSGSNEQKMTRAAIKRAEQARLKQSLERIQAVSIFNRFNLVFPLDSSNNTYDENGKLIHGFDLDLKNNRFSVYNKGEEVHVMNVLKEVRNRFLPFSRRTLILLYEPGCPLDFGSIIYQFPKNKLFLPYSTESFFFNGKRYYYNRLEDGTYDFEGFTKQKIVTSSAEAPAYPYFEGLFIVFQLAIMLFVVLTVISLLIIAIVKP